METLGLGIQMMIPNKPKCKESNQWIIGQNDNMDKGQVIYGSIREGEK